MHLHNFDSAAFLRDYWQKKPLLIRNPWGRWKNPLEPDEMAGLACEPEVESRIVVQTGGASPERWTLEHGPFDADRFAGLEEAPWTLLVQAVDQFVPEVAALVEPFRFVPDWRIDDVMVSYAVDGGGVGAHYDQYDVFLIQGLGRRRWRIGSVCGSDSPLVPHDDLRLLARFEATAEWVLEPGDILYLPPGVAHHGIAVGDDCMTYSVGFRAPARSELIADWCDHLLETMPDDDRYADPDLAAQANPGEIAPAALERLRAMIAEKLLDPAAFARWFGCYSSTPKYPEAMEQPEAPVAPDAVRARLADGEALLRNPASRFSFVRAGAGAVVLFADGESFECPADCAPLAERICATPLWAPIDAQSLSGAAIRLIVRLIDQGSLVFEADYEDDADEEADADGGWE